MVLRYIDRDTGKECACHYAGFLSLCIVTALLISALPVEAEPALPASLFAHYRQYYLPDSSGFVRAPSPVVPQASVAKKNAIGRKKWHEAAPPKTHRDAFTSYGVYLTSSSAGDESFFDATLDKLEAAGGTAIVFDVKGSRVYFHSNAPMANELKTVMPLMDLHAMVRRAKERGFYTIARFIALNDPGLSSRVPASQIRHPETGRSVGSKWTDGSAAETLEYNRQILREVAESGINEINLDYIRYPTEYPQHLIGLNGAQKAERIEKFLLMARETIDTYGSGAMLGISTYAILGWNFPVNFEPLGQDIRRFADIVDIVSPMAYPSTFAPGAYYNPAVHPVSRMYYLVWRTLEGYKELVGEENVKKLRPWIQGYYAAPADLTDEIRAVYDAGLCGFTVWSAGNHYDTLYGVLQNGHERPAHCL